MSGVCAAGNIWLTANLSLECWFLQHLIPTVQVSHITGPCLYCAWEQCKEMYFFTFISLAECFDRPTCLVKVFCLCNLKGSNHLVKTNQHKSSVWIQIFSLLALDPWDPRILTLRPVHLSPFIPLAGYCPSKYKKLTTLKSKSLFSLGINDKTAIFPPSTNQWISYL